MSAAFVSKTNPTPPRRVEARSNERQRDPRPSEPASRIIARSELVPDEVPPPSLVPDLREQVELDEAELTAYLSHLARGGDWIDVRVKDGPGAPSRIVERLPELHRLLLEKRLWGAQVMHLTAGVKVVDTLMVRATGILRVRTPV